MLDLRHGASTSLIELEFASHTGKDSDTDPGVPAGLPFYTLKAQLRELEMVFLNRFLQVWHLSFHPCICILSPLLEWRFTLGLPNRKRLTCRALASV